jgi:glycosyltransferase involved in cell wall biosynthesis
LKRPAISILMPTFNYARFLPEAIDSVLAQDFDDFELLVVDDCSTDDTAKVVQGYVSRDRRVQLAVNSKNLGMVNNWNQCLDRAQGEYIKFLFGDDKLFHRQALRYPSAVLAASARTILDEKSVPVDIYRDLKDGYHEGHSVITDCLMQNGKNLVGEPSAVLFRKTDARRGFDPKYQQITDVEMWFHLLERGGLAYSREALCAFRCHPSQQTERNTASGISRVEHALFFSRYAVQPWVEPRVVFPILFHLRRTRRKDRIPPDQHSLECEKRLTDRLRTQSNWYWYWLYCIQYLLSKPFRNLAHSVEKRAFRWSIRSSRHRTAGIIA